MVGPTDNVEAQVGPFVNDMEASKVSNETGPTTQLHPL